MERSWSRLPDSSWWNQEGEKSLSIRSTPLMPAEEPPGWSPDSPEGREGSTVGSVYISSIVPHSFSQLWQNLLAHRSLSLQEYVFSWLQSHALFDLVSVPPLLGCALRPAHRKLSLPTSKALTDSVTQQMSRSPVRCYSFHIQGGVGRDSALCLTFVLVFLVSNPLHDVLYLLCTNRCIVSVLLFAMCFLLV